VDVADDVEGSGGDEDVDEVQLDEGSPTVETASSIESSSDAGKQLRGYGGGELRVSVDELIPLLVWTKEKYQREP
jgi:hypothetical protein